MPKLAIFTNLQILFLIELFEKDSINNKKKEIPLRFNIRFNTNYSYNCLYLHYLKNSKINIDSFQNVNKSKSDEKTAISNTKRKLKNAVDSNILPISKKQKVIVMMDNNEFEINLSSFLNTIFYDNNLVVNYRENIDFFYK